MIIFRPSIKHTNTESENDFSERFREHTVIYPEVGSSIWQYIFGKKLFEDHIKSSVLSFSGQSGTGYEVDGNVNSKIPNIVFLGVDTKSVAPLARGIRPYSKLISNGSRTNNKIGIITLLNFQKFYFYTAGDIFKEQEAAITEYLKDKFMISVRKISHHMAKGNSCREQYTNDGSAAALASFGPTGQHGHPTEAARDAAQGADTLCYAYTTNISGSGVELGGNGTKFVQGDKSDIMVSTDSNLAEDGKFSIECIGKTSDNSVSLRILDYYMRGLSFKKLAARLKLIKSNRYLQLIPTDQIDLELDRPTNPRTVLSLRSERGQAYDICLAKQRDNGADVANPLMDFVFRYLRTNSTEVATGESGKELREYKSMTSFLVPMADTEIPKKIMKDNGFISDFCELLEREIKNDSISIHKYVKLFKILLNFIELKISKEEIDEEYKKLPSSNPPEKQKDTLETKIAALKPLTDEESETSALSDSSNIEKDYKKICPQSSDGLCKLASELCTTIQKKKEALEKESTPTPASSNGEADTLRGQTSRDTGLASDPSTNHSSNVDAEGVEEYQGKHRKNVLSPSRSSGGRGQD